MKALKHLIEQPFLIAVSIAAITHSTWSFATMFTGLEPNPQFTFAWFAWLIPNGLLAFSVDIGLLALATRIRCGERTPSVIAAFTVLSLAMCYAQFVYIISHVPSFPLAPGVREDWRALAQLGRDACIVVYPLLLPLALSLYAFSDKRAHKAVAPSADSMALVSQASVVIETPVVTVVDDKVEIECTHCAWAGAYDTKQSAQMALLAHLRRCKYAQPVKSANGTHNAHD